jgi:hypothetical protein
MMMFSHPSPDPPALGEGDSVGILSLNQKAGQMNP